MWLVGMIYMQTWHRALNHHNANIHAQILQGECHIVTQRLYSMIYMQTWHRALSLANDNINSSK